MQQIIGSRARLIVSSILLVLVLSACGGSADTAAPIGIDTSGQGGGTVISGSVGDGPIVGGNVVIMNRDGLIIASQASDMQSNYQITVNADGAEFPLIARVADGLDLVTGRPPDFPMVASIMRPGAVNVANLNPFGTLAVRTAEHMPGGLTNANLDVAVQIVRSVMNFGLDAGVFADPIRTTVTAANVANVVKASEALGEMIRRTRSALISAGQSTGAGQILDALGADLIDGILDGRGAPAADARIAATATIVSAQVILETLINRLNVDGVVTTQAVDIAIAQIMGSDPDVPLSGAVPVNAALLTQAQTAMDAAFNFSPGASLLLLREALDLIPSGALPAEVEVVLPEGSSDLLATSVEQISFATAAALETVNATVRQGGGTDGSAVNRPPTIGGAPAAQVTVGNLFDFTPAGSDPDGDAIGFSISGQPIWANFDFVTGRLWGVPGNGDSGVYNAIQISVSDGIERVDLPSFSITVNAIPNQPPTIGGLPPGQVTVGDLYSFTPVGSDPDGDVLNYVISGQPAWANFDPGTGRLWGMPGSGDAGVEPGIQIGVSDGSDTAWLPVFSVTVVGLPNRPPTIGGVPPTQVTVGGAYSFAPVASDPDGDTLTFSVSGQPSWTSFDPASGQLSGVPGSADEGVHSSIRISASDGSDTAALSAFSITVIGLPNQPPTIAGTPPAQVTVGNLYNFIPTASDAEGDPLIFSISSQPVWANFDPSTGQLSGTPGSADQGVHSNIRISVSDGSDTTTLSEFSITVTGLPNQPPAINGTPPTQVTVGDGYSFVPNASDADGDSLSFSISGRPGWASFDPATGGLLGTPQESDEGIHADIRISVSDGRDTSTLPAFAITVIGLPNQPPTINGTPQIQVTVGEVYSFLPTANDADGDSLAFSISGKPVWANFDAGNGRLWGTPGPNHTGSYPGIRISVSDGVEVAALGTFTITVDAPPNQPPTIGGTPATQVIAGDAYSFVPVASDPDGDSLSFGIQNLPAWANFDAGTGRLWGMPGAADEGDFTGIRISVSDGSDSASLGPFAISVLGLPNQPPVIGGVPSAQVMADSAYDFTPTASDPDGGSLTFSITGQPSWATFDPTTGRLWGTPDSADVATYFGVRISVSDGSDTATLPDFDITVVAQALGTATLSWAAPILNEDGTTLTDLAGYKIYVGASVTSLLHVDTVSNPTVTTHLVGNLTPGDWFFAVTAYDTSGNESQQSNVATWTFTP